MSKISKNKKTSNTLETPDTTLQKLTELEQKSLELQDKLARSLADYSNLEKRIESQRQLFVTLATTAIISKMIDVLDDLYLAQSHLNDPGLQMAIDKFTSTLKSEGLEEITTENQSFSPEIMECVDTTEGDENKVISVKKRGYKLNNIPIRPAQVVVGKSLVN
jgi:molecular chaperone GrpE